MNLLAEHRMLSIDSFLLLEIVFEITNTSAVFLLHFTYYRNKLTLTTTLEWKVLRFHNENWRMNMWNHAFTFDSKQGCMGLKSILVLLFFGWNESKLIALQFQHMHKKWRYSLIYMFALGKFFRRQPFLFESHAHLRRLFRVLFWK